jgi:tRNA U34 2-thiouridine synthase MnmA/TrmU
MAKTLALTSGGLDSRLAVKIMRDLGVEVVMAHFISIFSPRKIASGPGLSLKSFAKRVGAELITREKNGLMLEVIRKPAHGYGKNMNPCVDCRIAMLKKAALMMKEIGAEFITTGEVAGQRPMSQMRHTLRHIENEAGVKGLVLRPLSAKLLEPTLAEKSGLIDRKKLYGISGRGRHDQMRLAEELGIGPYPTPGGGCLLTFPEYSEKAADLVKAGETTLRDFHLLKMGRHFRLKSGRKIVLGRNERDDALIRSFASPGDLLIEPAELPGPTTLLRGKAAEDDIKTAAALTVRYIRAGESGPVEILVMDHLGREIRILAVEPMPREEAEKLMIGAKS